MVIITVKAFWDIIRFMCIILCIQSIRLIVKDMKGGK